MDRILWRSVASNFFSLYLLIRFPIYTLRTPLRMRFLNRWIACFRFVAFPGRFSALL